jgi:hypothetical protein
MSETFPEAAEKVAREMVDLLIKKQRDYGPKNILEFGLIGVLIRVNDKIERLKNLYGVKDGTFQEKVAKNESILDTWKDLGNYSIIAQLLINNSFELPMGEEQSTEDKLKDLKLNRGPLCNCDTCTHGCGTEKFYAEDNKQENPAWVCPWCACEEMWLDRSIAYLPDGTEEGMKNRCTNCGKSTDDIPTEKQKKEWEKSFKKLQDKIDDTDIPF